MSYFLQAVDGTVERVPSHVCPHCRKAVTAIEGSGHAQVARHADGSGCDITPGMARKLTVQNPRAQGQV